MAKVGATYKVNKKAAFHINTILEKRPYLGGVSGAINWALESIFEKMRVETSSADNQIEEGEAKTDT